MSEGNVVEFAMSAPQREQIAAWLNDKWKNKVCPHCQGPKWTVPLYVVSLRAAPIKNIGDLDLGSPLYPLLPISCANCGYVAFVNALTVGGIVPQGSADAAE